MATGSVKWFDTAKGFGFIVPDEGQGTNDLFVHQTDVQRVGFRFVDENDAVQYDVEEDSRGARAVNVRMPSGEIFPEGRPLQQQQQQRQSFGDGGYNDNDGYNDNYNDNVGGDEYHHENDQNSRQ